MFKLARFAGFANCKEASRLISRAQERRLSLRERMRLWLHLKRCIACQRYKRQLDVIREAMRHFRA
jgi:hypothetical protein